MNEVTLHRGRHPHLTVVDAYFDNQHLTEAVVSHLQVVSLVLTIRRMVYFYRHRRDLLPTHFRLADLYLTPKQTRSS